MNLSVFLISSLLFVFASALQSDGPVNSQTESLKPYQNVNEKPVISNPIDRPKSRRPLVRLFDNQDCKDDVAYLCGTNPQNNFAVLECIQSKDVSIFIDFLCYFSYF